VIKFSIPIEKVKKFETDDYIVNVFRPEIRNKFKTIKLIVYTKEYVPVDQFDLVRGVNDDKYWAWTMDTISTKKISIREKIASFIYCAT
jgi:hypothetical protein